MYSYTVILLFDLSDITFAYWSNYVNASTDQCALSSLPRRAIAPQPPSRRCVASTQGPAFPAGHPTATLGRGARRAGQQPQSPPRRGRFHTTAIASTLAYRYVAIASALYLHSSIIKASLCYEYIDNGAARATPPLRPYRGLAALAAPFCRGGRHVARRPPRRGRPPVRNWTP